METYSVKEIAETLHIHPETVRRWIRSGKLKSYQSSKRSGHVVTKMMLDEFLMSHPQYTAIVAPNDHIKVEGKDNLEMVIKALALSIERKQEIINSLQAYINLEKDTMETLSHFYSHYN